MLDALLKELLDSGRIRPLDQAFAWFIVSEEQQNQPLLGLLAAFLSNKLGEQHTCINLSELGQPFSDHFIFPPTDELIGCLAKANSVSLVKQGEKTPPRPIIVDGNKVYLQRYWQYERQLAAIIGDMSQKTVLLDEPLARDLVVRLFGASANAGTGIDYQKIAVCLAASQRLSLITGGPGTGKTTTVTRLLALLQSLARAKGRVLNMQLVAPTGKAAARLSASIQQAKLKLADDLSANLPDQCSTIHRLLGAKHYSPYFKHHNNNRLHLDVLVLDEASMVDLSLMCKLLQALPDHAQLIMLGDKDQLASVEAGSVLSDLCAAALGENTLPVYSQSKTSLLNSLCGYQLNTSQDSKQVLGDNLVVLQKSHRFSAQSGVGQLASSINRGDIKQTLALFSEPGLPDIQWHKDAQRQDLIAKLMPLYKEYFTAVSKGDVQAAFACLSRQQVLCAQRSGSWGVEQLNMLIEQELHKQGLVDLSRDFYPGRPIMLSQNEHNLRLFNGDIGIVMADAGQPNLFKVWFISPEGQLRSLLPGRLPSHESLYAMTIHKSQGSEFDEVYLCLPQDDKSSFVGLNRGLLYTGLTRARSRFSLYANAQGLQSSLQQQARRGSGLAERLL